MSAKVKLEAQLCIPRTPLLFLTLVVKFQLLFLKKCILRNTSTIKVFQYIKFNRQSATVCKKKGCFQAFDGRKTLLFQSHREMNAFFVNFFLTNDCIKTFITVLFSCWDHCLFLVLHFVLFSPICNLHNFFNSMH